MRLGTLSEEKAAQRCPIIAGEFANPCTTNYFNWQAGIIAKPPMPQAAPLVAPFSAPPISSGFSVLFCRLCFAATSGVCLIRSGAAGFSKEATFAKKKSFCARFVMHVSLQCPHAPQGRRSRPPGAGAQGREGAVRSSNLSNVACGACMQSCSIVHGMPALRGSGARTYALRRQTVRAHAHA